MFGFKNANQASAASEKFIAIADAKVCQTLISSQANGLTALQLAAPYGTRSLTDCDSTIQSVRTQPFQWILHPLGDWLR